MKNVRLDRADDRPDSGAKGKANSPRMEGFDACEF